MQILAMLMLLGGWMIAVGGLVTSDGPYYRLPLTEGDGVSGMGKALKPTIHPVREEPDMVATARARSQAAVACRARLSMW